MVLLNADNINKSYTVDPLIDNVTLSISEGEKIGLIGVNGTGKSTLLRILAGVEEPDSGTITRTRNTRIAYMPQNPDYDGNLTVAEQAAFYLRKVDPSADDFRCHSLLTKMRIRDLDALMGNLSGGQRKRVALAAVLAAEAELIILDEPTNHMDNDIIAWMEDFLVNTRSALIMITHDRYFLDRVTRRILEIDRGKIFSYDGNYDYYLETKAARIDSMKASERKRAALYKKELAWIQRGARARSTKAKSHIERFEELRDSKLIIDDTSLSIGTVSSRLGRKIIEIENVSKAFDSQSVINDFTYTVLRNDRIGIIGDNGAGKSTLLKIITGELKPDSGSVSIGETVKIGYFSQETRLPEEDLRVIKFAEQISDNVRTDEGTFSASQMLDRFLFSGFKQSMMISRLSGGEKRRLCLLSILMQAPNVLILDEPTNDLDIETLTILEDYLDSFQGALIIVSHDRYFLDRLCRRTFAFTGDGVIRHLTGGYTDAMKALELEALEAEMAGAAGRGAAGSGKSGGSAGSGKSGLASGADRASGPDLASGTDDAGRAGGGRDAERPRHRQKLKFSFKEQKEYETIDSDIEELEEAIAEIDADMAASASDYGRLQELSEKRAGLAAELEEKENRWIYLTDLADRIAAQDAGN
ncbi:MAG: ABC-F family ATP-binding cassette domain-containing protein [Clostridia bacterium]|nr:ABC-F family ATP-binding cassette domain-containing protein [Clostridia bacterium]